MNRIRHNLSDKENDAKYGDHVTYIPTEGM